MLENWCGPAIDSHDNDAKAIEPHTRHAVARLIGLEGLQDTLDRLSQYEECGKYLPPTPNTLV